METWMWAIWLAIMVAAVVIEAITVDLISVWFVVGAFVSMLISFIPNVPWWVQIVIFAVVSGATLVLLRPFAKRFMDRDLVKTNVDTKSSERKPSLRSMATSWTQQRSSSMANAGALFRPMPKLSSKRAILS